MSPQDQPPAETGGGAGGNVESGASDDVDTRADGRLVVASNRLPVVLRRADGGWDVEPGSGGLVTALAPVLRERGGTWVGWPGTLEADHAELRGPLGELSGRAGYDLEPVGLTREERDNYYYGFSNEVLWPLLHELQTRYRYDLAYWDAYRRVNEKFARALAEAAGPRDYVWVHDYHLMDVGRALRGSGHDDLRTGYFLHTPFPSPSVFVKLPWRDQILRGLLSYDLLGFQTLRDRENFLDCTARILPDATVGERSPVARVRHGDRTVRVGAFPISIDVDEFGELAGSPAVREAARKLEESFTADRLVLSVNRLDYTKGIPHQIEAFRDALERFPALRRRASLVLVVVPSREGIGQYEDLRGEIEGLVGQVNGQFGQEGWVPVHFFYRSLDRPELVAYYRRADAALVTPLQDGMNLVAKEYCISSLDDRGVLILSEFAGAAAQLQDGALLVNPFDVVGTSLAIHRALEMDEEERRRRMRTLREAIRRHDIHWWVDRFLRAARGEDVEPAPPAEPYAPGSPRE